MTLEPFSEGQGYRLYLGDCVEVMRSMPEDSVDAVVTDPPYFLRFMGRKWDHAPSPSEQQRQHQEWAREALRVLKPGGFLLAFGGTRTVHRLTCAIEDAGFEIRDSITWLYGSGFPKSLDVSKAIDKMAGTLDAQAKAFNAAGRGDRSDLQDAKQTLKYRADYGYSYSPATEAAKQWEGWGTALKPAHEPICVARKPFSESSVARNVLEHGTGALNIDGSRIGWDAAGLANDGKRRQTPRTDITNGSYGKAAGARPGEYEGEKTSPSGRWPANALFSHSPECNGECVDGCPVRELGEPARFFYCAKSSRAERNKGLEGMPEKVKQVHMRSANGTGKKNFEKWPDTMQQNTHPTVKPLALMRYLVKLVTPPGGVVLDPFAGSGSTLVAAIQEGFEAIGIEQEEEYAEICAARCRLKPSVVNLATKRATNADTETHERFTDTLF